MGAGKSSGNVTQNNGATATWTHGGHQSPTLRQLLQQGILSPANVLYNQIAIPVHLACKLQHMLCIPPLHLHKQQHDLPIPSLSLEFRNPIPLIPETLGDLCSLDREHLHHLIPDLEQILHGHADKSSRRKTKGECKGGKRVGKVIEHFGYGKNPDKGFKKSDGKGNHALAANDHCMAQGPKRYIKDPGYKNDQGQQKRFCGKYFATLMLVMKWMHDPPTPYRGYQKETSR